MKNEVNKMKLKKITAAETDSGYEVKEGVSVNVSPELESAITEIMNKIIPNMMEIMDVVMEKGKQLKQNDHETLCRSMASTISANVIGMLMTPTVALKDIPTKQGMSMPELVKSIKIPDEKTIEEEIKKVTDVVAKTVVKEMVEKLQLLKNEEKTPEYIG